jgi:hypothetical protein
MKDKVMLIRYDGKPARQHTDKDGKLVPCFQDSCGFGVYIMDLDMAISLAMINKNRYRYYRSPTADMQYTDPATGARRWGKLHSWVYEKVVISVGKDDNGEEKYETRIKWREDKEDKFVVTASEKFITGREEKKDVSKEMNLVTGENAELKAANESLRKTVAEQGAELKEVKSNISELKASSGKGKKK